MPTQPHDGWTTSRQIYFLRALSHHFVVTRAALDNGIR